MEMGQPGSVKIDPLAFEIVKGCQLLSFSEKEGSNYEMFSRYMVTDKCMPCFLITCLYSWSVFPRLQVKCFMKQLLSGIEHCHNNGVLHRDIKTSNLLVSSDGILKIADFGLATSYDPENARPMTSQVITLWYRPPELLLGATHYGVGVDLWSVGCILAELLLGEPIFPGRTEVLGLV